MTSDRQPRRGMEYVCVYFLLHGVHPSTRSVGCIPKRVGWLAGMFFLRSTSAMHGGKYA